jgi:hypothetical protein
MCIVARTRNAVKHAAKRFQRRPTAGIASRTRPGFAPLGSATRHFSAVIHGGLRLPEPFRDLGSHTTLPELRQGFGGISFVRCQGLEPLPRSPWTARADCDRIQQPQDLSTLSPLASVVPWVTGLPAASVSVGYHRVARASAPEAPRFSRPTGDHGG